jgi:hypothetical protein
VRDGERSLAVGTLSFRQLGIAKNTNLMVLGRLILQKDFQAGRNRAVSGGGIRTLDTPLRGIPGEAYAWVRVSTEFRLSMRDFGPAYLPGPTRMNPRL